jgi:fatty-acyl-CoA synthase
MSTVAELVGDAATETPDREAMVFDEASLTYGHLHEQSLLLAAALRRAGLLPGQRVAVLAPSCNETVQALVACSLTGAVFVPLNFRYRVHELTQVLSDSRPTIVIVDDDPDLGLNRTDLLRQVIGPWSADGTTDASSMARANYGIGRVVRLTPHTSAHDSYAAFTTRTSDLTVDSIAARHGALAIIYTSGTTAAPKGVLVPEAAFTRRQAAIAQRLGIREHDRVFSPLPLFHIAGYIPLLSAFHARATYVTNRYFEPDAACATVARHQCRVAWSGFDTILRAMLDASDAGAGSLDSLEADALIGPPPTMQALERRLERCRLVLIYGSTELGSAATLPSPDDDLAIRTETCGRELDGITLAVLGPSGDVLPPGQSGEICGRGIAVTSGYYAAGAAPLRTGFDAEGWFHSGDLGIRTADGDIKYVSRLKDLIKVGGENVTAAEIEDFLIRHPQVEEVQVIGVTDPTDGEVPVAFVQWAADASGAEDELRAFCAGQLSRVRIPRHFVFLTEDEWPRSATKIRKVDLQAMFAARHVHPADDRHQPPEQQEYQQ